MRDNTSMLNRLEEISTDFDNVIKVLRGSEADRKVKVRNWIITGLLIPISTLFDLKEFFKGTKKLSWGAFVPAVAGTIFAPMLSSFMGIPWYILLVIGLLIGYIFSLIFIAPRLMCTFDSGYFRIAAYALFRKQEFNLFHKGLLQDDSLYFTPIYTQFALLLSKEDLSNSHLELIHERIDRFLNQEKMELYAKNHALQEKLTELENMHGMAIKDYHNKAKTLVADSYELHTGIGYLVEFIAATNTALYRKKNNHFNMSDIVQMLSCGITIYKVQDNWLIKEYDEGTSGASLAKYPLVGTHPEYKEHAVVRAALNEINVEEIDTPYGNRFIIARKMKMDYEETWVINFHLEETAAKSLFLTVTDDILKTEEVFRTVHAICLLKQEADHMRGVS